MTGDDQISPLDQYLYVLSGHESGHNLQAVNPTTGAAGLLQFEPGTWAGLRQSHPELGLPATVGEANEDQQIMAGRALTSDNARALTAAGIPVNASNLYMAHFMGAGGAITFMRALRENPNASFAELFPSEAAANPTLAQGRTVAQFYQMMSGRMTGQGTTGLRARGSRMPFDMDNSDLGLLSPRAAPIVPTQPTPSDIAGEAAQAFAQTAPRPTPPAQFVAPSLAPAAPAQPLASPSIANEYAALMRRRQPLEAVNA
jgi:Transglycosylase-like domain